MISHYDKLQIPTATQSDEYSRVYCFKQKTWSSKHVVLDQAALLLLRPDMRVMMRKPVRRNIMDCLHFCVSPSPLDMTTSLLMNALRFL